LEKRGKTNGSQGKEERKTAGLQKGVQGGEVTLVGIREEGKVK